MMNRLSDFLHQNIVIRVPVWIFLLLPLAAYLAWEIYWYSRVGLRFIKWHTHLMLFAYIWMAGMLVLRILSEKKREDYFKKIALSFNALIFTFFLLEVTLLITGINKTYLEKVDSFYTSPYQALQSSYYHTWRTNKQRCLIKPEYHYCALSNSLGFVDEEWKVNKKPGEKTIIALGDSFTEGDGAPYDSSYVALLREKLNSRNDSFYVMNAGICGSDPFNNFVILRDLLMVYEPDYVIQVLSSHDLITDIILRGGMERFREDGTVKHYSAPWWEPVYAISYSSRIFFNAAGYDELLRRGEITNEEEAKLNEQVIELFRMYARFCRENNIKLFVSLRPDKFEIESNNYSFDFSLIQNELMKNENIIYFDLLPDYLEYIEQRKTQPADYFWVHDGHHNSNGYQMMADAIFDNIRPYLNDSTISEF